MNLDLWEILELHLGPVFSSFFSVATKHLLYGYCVGIVLLGLSMSGTSQRQNVFK